MVDYERALEHFQAGNWADLGRELDIPNGWWDTILKGICKTDEFKEVIEKRRDPSVFKKLDKQLTTLSQHTPIPAPYTGDEAIEALRHGELLPWKSKSIVMLHYSTPGEEEESVKTYCWSLYHLEWPPGSHKPAHAFALDPPFKTAWHLLQRKKTRELLDAFEIRQSWNVGGQLAQVFYHERFRKVLRYKAVKEVEGKHMYTKFSDAFSLIRGQKRPLTSNKDSNQMIAFIILADRMIKEVYRVLCWVLYWNAKSGNLSYVYGWVPVYRTALDLYIMQHWDGLRDLFDIDETWWDELLKKMFKGNSFLGVLRELYQKEQSGVSIYPQFNNIFSWTRVPECKPADVKVIIVGQDPLPECRSTGMSFLLMEKGKGCPSIENIFSSVKDNFGIKEDIKHLCPYSWFQQGVLLLNTLMTISKDQEGHKTRHTSIGWEKITTSILEYFIDNQRDRSLHILLWSSYWTSGHDGKLRGNKRPIEKLRQRPSGKRTTVIHNTHPSRRNGRAFFKETTSRKRRYFFDDDTRTTMELFKEEVTTVGWTSIRDGMPSIPAGVIHPTIGPKLTEIDLDVGQ